MRDLSVRDVAYELEDLLYRQPFRIPAQFAFTGRAIGTLSGLATGLAPDFNLVAVSIPYAQKFLGLNRDGATQSAQQLLTQVLDAGRTLLTLPASLERVLTKIEAGQVEFRVAENGRNGALRGRIARATRGGGLRASTALPLLAIGIASLAAGAALIVNQDLVAGWFCLGLAGLAVVGLAFRR